MSTNNELLFTTPTARLVQGSVYESRSADQDGQPYIYKTGAKAGQPYSKFFIAIAIPKNPGIPWENETWGQMIMQTAKAASPASFDPTTGLLIQGRPMNYNVIDGDSQIPSPQAHKKPCDNEGFPGHWVLRCNKNDYAPVTSHFVNGVAVPLTEQIIKRGHYVQVRVAVRPNSDHRNPGVFLQHNMINHVGYGPEIISGPSIESAGFNAADVPSYVSQTPIAPTEQAAPPVQQAAPPVQQAAPPVQQAAPPVQQAAPPVQQAAPPVQQAAPPVQPATDLIQQVEASYNYNGNVYTHSQLLAMPGWTEEIIATLPRV
jgi:hypothetical protein